MAYRGLCYSAFPQAELPSQTVSSYPMLGAVQLEEAQVAFETIDVGIRKTYVESQLSDLVPCWLSKAWLC